ncbi:MAG: DALR anticodon-binding domain-containing protein, partial [Rhodospirillaceae bacterium]
DLSDTALADSADPSLLTDADEIALMRLVAGWPRLVEGAAEAHEPHRLAYYMNDVASAFHQLWNKGRENAELRFLDPENRPLSLARLALVRSAATVIASGLTVFGVQPVEEMR